MVYMEVLGGKNKELCLKNKPCPFCGGKDITVTEEESFERIVEKNGTAMMDVKCTNCRVDLPLFNVPMEKYWLGVGILVGMWNTREVNSDAVEED